MNVLQALGLQSPGIASDDDYGGVPAAPPPAVDPAAAPPQVVDPAAAPPQAVDPAAAAGVTAPAPAPANVLQAAAPPSAVDPASAPAAPPQAPAAAPVNVLQAAATQPARARSSLLDTIGRISDVLAQVGGATPLYQPTLNARQDRVLALGDHDRAVAESGLDQQAKLADITQTGGAIGAQQMQNARTATKALQSLITANPGRDVGATWAALASQAHLPQDQANALGRIFASDPKSIAAFADSADGEDKEKYGGLPVYVRDPQGNLHIRQMSLTGNDSRDPLPEGWTPADPTKAVNFGGVTGFVGQHSDQPSNYVANTEKPGTEADRAERAREADNRNAMAIYQADAKAHGGKATANPAAALGLIDNLQRGFDALHNMSALPGDTNNPVMGIAATIGRTGVGQWLSAQAGTPAGQMRQQVYKNLSLLQQEMIKSLPASATRSRFEQEIVKKALPDPAMLSYDTANNLLAEYRQSYSKALSDANQEFSGSGSRPRPVLRPYGGSSGAPVAIPVTKPVLPNTPRGGLHDIVPWGSR